MCLGRLEHFLKVIFFKQELKTTRLVNKEVCCGFCFEHVAHYWQMLALLPDNYRDRAFQLADFNDKLITYRLMILAATWLLTSCEHRKFSEDEKNSVC